MIQVGFEPARIRGLIDKYVAERQRTVDEQWHFDARQQVYHAVGGAFLALFETLAELFAGVASDDQATATELQKLMQITLEQYRQTATMQTEHPSLPAIHPNDLFDLLYGQQKAS